MEKKAKLCAERLLSLAPRLMQTLRAEMRAGRASGLTVPQFRMLVFTQNHAGGTLSDAAEHLGLALPSASKLLENLVGRGLLTRETSAEDRRRLVIALTAAGAQMMLAARRSALAAFTDRLSGLGELELDVLFAALGLLEGLTQDRADKAAEPKAAKSAKTAKSAKSAKAAKTAKATKKAKTPKAAKAVKKSRPGKTGR